MTPHFLSSCVEMWESFLISLWNWGISIRIYFFFQRIFFQLTCAFSSFYIGTCLKVEYHSSILGATFYLWNWILAFTMATVISEWKLSCISFLFCSTTIQSQMQAQKNKTFRKWKDEGERERKKRMKKIGGWKKKFKMKF
jgi:hypothetical protein